MGVIATTGIEGTRIVVAGITIEIMMTIWQGEPTIAIITLSQAWVGAVVEDEEQTSTHLLG